MITVSTLRVDYENVIAVNDVNIEVLPGQIYGLVGPNGAGKTSTIKALAGIIEPTYGEIKINNFDIELVPEKALRELGYMPDFSPVYENLKVWEYLEVFAAAYFIEQKHRLECARLWVSRVNLMDKWDAYIHTLSRGMRQRLILAKTLLHDPTIVLLDEPASGLDPMARIEMRNILKDIAAAGKSIIISSHILAELSDFCNAIGVMEKGKMVISGSIDHIRSAIGAKSMLVFHCLRPDEHTKEIVRGILGRYAFIGAVSEPIAGEFHCPFAGSLEDRTIVLTELVKANIRVSQYFIKEANVEDIFFKIGAKEVS